jgi:glutamine amidotransferase
MKQLQAKGFDQALEKFSDQGKYILGICLGMQLLTLSSEEGSEKGLGLIQAKTKKFVSVDQVSKKLTVPHMGWNQVIPQNLSNNLKLFNQLDMNTRFYFVHSYYVECQNKEDRLFTCYYGLVFDAGFKKDNIIGVQFHPEKSHRFGMQFMKNFSELD